MSCEAPPRSIAAFYSFMEITFNLVEALNGIPLREVCRPVKTRAEKVEYKQQWDARVMLGSLTSKLLMQ